jgi:hypothetical protein
MTSAQPSKKRKGHQRRQAPPQGLGVGAGLELFGDRGTKAEETFVAGFAAIRNLEQQILADKILRAPSRRPANSVAAAMGANGKVITLSGFGHGGLPR